MALSLVGTWPRWWARNVARHLSISFTMQHLKIVFSVARHLCLRWWAMFWTRHLSHMGDGPHRCRPSPMTDRWRVMHLHLNLKKAIQTTVHCSCTYTFRKQIQSYYIKIQTTSNVHCSIIIWDIKIQNLQLHLHFQKANSDCCTHCNCTYPSRKKIQTVAHCSCTYTSRK